MFGLYRKFVKDYSKKLIHLPSKQTRAWTLFGIRKRKRHGNFLEMSWLELPFEPILIVRRILSLTQMPGSMALERYCHRFRMAERGSYPMTVTKEARCYCVTHQELLPVVNFVNHFSCYLYVGGFWFEQTIGPWNIFLISQGQMAKWLLAMYTYTFDIEHRAGKRHGNADAISRGPCKQCVMKVNV